MARREHIPEVRQVTGVVMADGRVNVSGAHLDLPYPAGYIPSAGDLVSVDIVNGHGRVTGPIIRGQRPAVGTVSGPPSGGLVPLSTSAGTVRAWYAGTAPDVSDVVFIDWQSTTPRVISTGAPSTPTEAPGVPAAPKPTPPAPPPKIQTGVLYVVATGSAGYTPTRGWNLSYPIQGTEGGRTWTGAWFYGTRPRQIKGRTVTKIMFRLPAMRGGAVAGDAVHLYTHASNSRPSGNVSLVAGPYNVTARTSARWVTLPTAWGQAIVDSGGGIAIHGTPMVWLTGITRDAASGQLAISWRG